MKNYRLTNYCATTLRLLRPRAPGAALLLAALLGPAGCEENTTIVAPTPPPNIIDTVAGTLTPYSARIHGFAVSNPGSVSAILTELTEPDPDPDPDALTVVGVDLGTLIGSTCQVVVSRVDVTKSQSVTGAATAAGPLCVRIYDVSAAGLPTPVTYTMTLSHY